MTNAGTQAAALANLSPMYTSGGLEVGAFESEILESIVRRSQIKGERFPVTGQLPLRRKQPRTA
jgi:hypothetical protein